MSDTIGRNSAARERYASTAIQKTALVVGIVFLLVGAAGFIPGLTHSADHLEGAGADSGALLLGVFQVSVLHNALHLLFGVAGLVLAARARWSRGFLFGGGVIYLILWIYGLFAVGSAEANVIPVNEADNWLHLGLAIGMIGLGTLARPREAARADGKGRMSDAMRTDTGDPNDDRAYLSDVPPAQVEDDSVAKNLVSEDQEEPGSEAKAARNA